MNLDYAHAIEYLPPTVQQALQSASVFYSRNYERYLTRKHKLPIYIYSDDYCALFVKSRIYVFRYVDLPVEYLALTHTPTTTPQAFLDACLVVINQQFHVHWTNPPSSAAVFAAYPSRGMRIPFGSHIIDLTASEDTLWVNVHSKHRNAIRRAEKGGVVIKAGGMELLHDYLLLDQETWERSGRESRGKPFFADLLDAMGDACIVFVAYKDAVPQGGALFLYSPAMCYYMFGASADQPKPGAMNLLHWYAMLNMRNRSVKRYSFVGCRINEDEESKYHNLQRFKSRFSGELVQGYMFKVVLNRSMYGLFRLLLRIRKGNHPWTCEGIDQELHQWPELNR